MNCRDIITIAPGKRGGKPCVRGLRSTVCDVLDPGFRRGNDGWRPDLRHSRESGNPEG
jgi:uncharacterized protein (DUF433 family)